MDNSSYLELPPPSWKMGPFTEEAMKQKLVLSFKFVDELSDRICAHVIIRGDRKGQQCPRKAIQGSYFCCSCSVKRPNITKDKPQLPEARFISMEMNFVPVESDDEDEGSSSKEKVDGFGKVKRTKPDALLVSKEGKKFYMHKLILTALGKFFREGLKGDAFHVNAFSNTLNNFRNLVYGQIVYLEHWSEAFELVSWLNMTVDRFGAVNKSLLVCGFHVDKNDYDAYMTSLSYMYNDDIPDHIIVHSLRYLE